ncbi:MAG TPA: hypothetical protein VND83_02710 [Acidimicrobiales bacterium]|nr:hypothetical protein [Acidimicrobiales bacterium]
MLAALSQSTGASGFLIVAFVFLGLVWYVLPFFAILRAATFPSTAFREIGRNKTIWVVLPLVLGFLAAAYFYAFVYPQLKVVAHPALDLA